MSRLTDTGISYDNASYKQDSAGTYIASSNAGSVTGTTTIEIANIPSTVNKLTAILANGSYSGGPQSPITQVFCGGVVVSNVESVCLNIGATSAVGWQYTSTTGLMTANPYQTMTHLKLEIYRVRQYTYMYRFNWQGSGNVPSLMGFGRFSGAGDLNMIRLNSHSSTAYPWSSINYRVYYE
jgi:hypothetical protein